MSYEITRAAATPSLAGNWEEAAWKDVTPLTVGIFHSRSSDHHPLTEAKVVYDDEALYVHFRIQDQYVLSVNTELHGLVCQDSCAEFFVEPKPERGYFNFEINAGGTLHVSYIEDPTRTENGFEKYRFVEPEVAAKVTIYHSLPEKIDPEITEPVTWSLEYRVPFELFSHYVGDLGEIPGSTWRANFYKCADKCSHPHWGMWHDVGEPLNFHKPDKFQPVVFVA